MPPISVGSANQIGLAVDAAGGQTLKVAGSANVEMIVQIRYIEAPHAGQPLERM